LLGNIFAPGEFDFDFARKDGGEARTKVCHQSLTRKTVSYFSFKIRVLWRNVCHIVSERFLNHEEHKGHKAIFFVLYVLYGEFFSITHFQLL
jgi:hypothetical protein